MPHNATNWIEMRRSQRVLLRLRIHVRWTPHRETAIIEDTTTLVVNAHGALIALEMTVKAGMRSFIRNPALADDTECRVVRVQETLGGQDEVGVECLRW